MLQRPLQWDPSQVSRWLASIQHNKLSGPVAQYQKKVTLESVDGMLFNEIVTSAPHDLELIFEMHGPARLDRHRICAEWKMLLSLED